MKNEQKMVITIQKIPYQVTGIIGQGAASVVYLAKQIKGKKSVAIKNIRNYKDPIMKEAVNAEIKIQSSFKNCPFVIQYLGVEVLDKQVFIALELGEYTLRKFVDMKILTEPDLVMMLNNVLEGLFHIHKNLVMHRDIKPENIIFQEQEAVYKITDFGVSSEGTEDDSFVGTPLYFPPEMLFDKENKKYTQKVDIWSLGVSAFQSYFRIHPFFYSENKEIYQVLKQMKENIQALTPDFTMDKFLHHINKKGLTRQVAYVQKKLNITKQSVVENLCAFFQPDPDHRMDSEYFTAVWKSIKESLSFIKSQKKTRLYKNVKRKNLPCDLELFCKAKDMHYEINAHVEYKGADKNKLNVPEALELAAWFLQGKVYGGQNFILLDCLEKISTYRPPKEQLWRQVQKTLHAYYWSLKEEQYQFYNKINELRLHILCCGVWTTLQQNSQAFCKNIKKISDFECVDIFEILKYAGLYSEKSLNKIQQNLLEFYDFDLILS